MIVPPLLVDIADDFGVSVPVAGQLATATFAAWAISVVSVGPLSDSFGRRPVLIAGLSVLSVSVIGAAFAPNLEVLLVLRVATGLGGGMLPPNAIGALTEVISPARRAQAIGALMSVNVLSSALSVPLIALAANWGGWRFAFVVCGLMLATSLLASWFLFPADSRERIRNFAFFSRFGALLSLRYFRVAVLVNVSHRMAFWALVSYFAAYLIATYEVSVGYVALPLAITAIGQVVGSYSSALVVKQRNRFSHRCCRIAGGRSLWTAVLFVRPVALDSSGGGHRWIRTAERGLPNAGCHQHGIFRRIQGYGRRPHGGEQSGWRCVGGSSCECPAGQFGLCRNRLHVPGRYDRMRTGNAAIRTTGPVILRLIQERVRV